MPHLNIKNYPQYLAPDLNCADYAKFNHRSSRQPSNLFETSTLTKMSNIPSHAQPSGGNLYEGWRNVIGIGHGKDWGTKYSESSSWPARFNSKPSATIIEPVVTVSQSDQLRKDYDAEVDDVAKVCGFSNTNMGEVTQKEAEETANEEKRRKLIELLRYNPNSRTTALLNLQMK
ncbi:hypothetical protein SLS60_010964 [Paraconiothyrium brasiliense]|uniref:Uncharacterized protein n=1 Tax=Paraconiothyrium brasiliense TaxID=300254 RepID=A0ABR3QMI4_9PLEO